MLTQVCLCQCSSAAHIEDERGYANSQPCSMPSVVVKFDFNRALFRVVVVLIYIRAGSRSFFRTCWSKSAGRASK